MIDNPEHISFYKSKTEIEDDPFKLMIHNIINLVDYQIALGYLKNIIKKEEYGSGTILVVIVANLFTNMCHKLLLDNDMKTRIEAFDAALDELNGISRELFLALQAMSASENNKN